MTRQKILPIKKHNRRARAASVERLRELELNLRRQSRELDAFRESLAVALAEAAEAQDTKNAFLAKVSHELRTPISGVLGMTELLLCEPSLSLDSVEMLCLIQESAENLLVLINEVLLFAEIEAGRVVLCCETFNCNEVVNDCCTSFMSTATNKSIRLFVDICPNIPTQLYGDAALIQQVLTNLIANALKFTLRGTVGVSVSLVEHDAELCLRMVVHDQGVGVQHTSEALMFEPFLQGDNSSTRKFGGLGLGLAIAKQLLALANGTLSFENCDEGGSNFWFEMPVSIAD